MMGWAFAVGVLIGWFFGWLSAGDRVESNTFLVMPKGMPRRCRVVLEDQASVGENRG